MMKNLVLTQTQRTCSRTHLASQSWPILSFGSQMMVSQLLEAKEREESEEVETLGHCAIIASCLTFSCLPSLTFATLRVCHASSYTSQKMKFRNFLRGDVDFRGLLWSQPPTGQTGTRQWSDL